MRDFAVVFRRVIDGPFAGDAAPVGAEIVNDPTSGVGALFRMELGRRDATQALTRRFQGYYTAVGFAGTLTLELWINSGSGTIPNDWIAVGDPAVPPVAIGPNRLFQTCGLTEDADAFVQVTPSAPLILGESITIFLEEVS